MEGFMKNVNKSIALFGFFATLTTSTTWAMRPDFQQQLKERKERLEKERQEKFVQEHTQNPMPQPQEQTQETIQFQLSFDEDIEAIFLKYGLSDPLFCQNNNNNIANNKSLDASITNTDNPARDKTIIITNALSNNSNNKKRKREQEDTLHNDIKKIKIPANEVQLDKLYQHSKVMLYFPRPNNQNLITEKYTVNKKVLEQLLNCDNLNVSCESNNETALHYAVEYRDLATVKKLLNAAGADVNVQDKQGRTPLHLCAKQDNLILGARIIPGRNIDISRIDLLSTALISLPSEEIGQKRTEIIDLLIEYGADPNLQDNQGATPLPFILSNILKDNNSDEEFNNLLHSIEVLLKKGAYLNDSNISDVAKHEPISINGIKHKDILINLLLKYNISFDREHKKLMVNAWTSHWKCNK